MLRSAAVVHISAQSALPTELQVSKEHACILHMCGTSFSDQRRSLFLTRYTQKNLQSVSKKKKKVLLGSTEASGVMPLFNTEE